MLQLGLKLGRVLMDDRAVSFRAGDVHILQVSLAVPDDSGASAIPWCKQIPAVFVCGLALHDGFALKVLSALCLYQCQVLATIPAGR